VIIRLTFGEMSMGACIASMRYTSNIVRQRPHQHGQTSYRWPGADLCAEIAVARYLNLFWNGDVSNTKERDVGGMVDVRACAPGLRLILHREDPDDVPFVLAWVTMPTIELMGWMLARDGKREEFWCEPQPGRPCFLVPKHIPLHDMPSLRDWVDDRVRSHFLEQEGKTNGQTQRFDREHSAA
jgi:hypothetical protein